MTEYFLCDRCHRAWPKNHWPVNPRQGHIYCGCCNGLPRKLHTVPCPHCHEQAAYQNGTPNFQNRYTCAACGKSAAM